MSAANKPPAKETLTCQSCAKEPATVHVTEMADGKVQPTRRLCDACARKQAGPSPWGGALLSTIVIQRGTGWHSTPVSTSPSAMRASDLINQAVINKARLTGQAAITIGQIADALIGVLKAGHRIYIMGNGGSAADAQHFAAELVGRFKRERRGLPAVALTTDTSCLTAVGNDYGFDSIFVRQVEALVEKGDAVIGITTSGNSPNVVKAIERSKSLGAVTIGLSGERGGRLAELCDVCLNAPGASTDRVQECHITVIHTLCEIIEETLFGGK